MTQKVARLVHIVINAIQWEGYYFGIVSTDVKAKPKEFQKADEVTELQKIVATDQIRIQLLESL